MRLFTSSETEQAEEAVKEFKPSQTSSSSESPSPFISNAGTRLVEEDALLIQIDEFRRKAEALQSLINERQDRVLVLEQTVKEKESKNSVLQDELIKKQEALSGVLEDLKAQFDILADRVDTSVNNAVTEAKEPVIEKIHSENVRLYRNIYDFIKEDYDTEEFEALIKKTSKVGKGPIIASLFLSIFDTVLLVVLLLFQFGIL